MTTRFDPRISLATTMHAQPGVYALLIGSGVSTGAGIPTGWGVVEALVRQVAAASLDGVSEDFDAEVWWDGHGDGQPLGYSALLSLLASTPAARRGLLQGFFEPTDDDRDQGLKVPTAAHRAIAELVGRGAVRVIITTNFDRLIEQALEAEGIFPQVIASDAAIAGMEPLAHAACTVIKLHGDYATLDQLNTLEELSAYSDAKAALLRRVIDEYGLIVCGWSGEWDVALVSSLQEAAVRRYPLFWSARSNLRCPGKELVAQHRATVVAGMTADQFFSDLVERLDALDQLANPPLTVAMAIAQLKTFLPDPARHLRLRDLLDGQIADVQSLLLERSGTPPDTSVQTRVDDVAGLRSRCDLLLHLLAHGVYLDRDRQHTGLWVWVIDQLLNVRRVHKSFQKEWDDLQHYPALLALRTVVAAALAAHHEDVAVRVMRDPIWREHFGSRELVSATRALDDHVVINYQVAHMLDGGTKWRFPHSHHLRETLRPVLGSIVGDDDEAYEAHLSRVEYRVALASHQAELPYPAVGEFIGDFQWESDGGPLRWEEDFLERGDREAWGQTEFNAVTFGADLRNLTTELRQAISQ